MSINACTINAFTINGLCNIPSIVPPVFVTGGGGSTYHPRWDGETRHDIPVADYDYIEVKADLCGYFGSDRQDVSNSMMPMVYVSNINIEDVDISISIDNVRKE